MGFSSGAYQYYSAPSTALSTTIRGTSKAMDNHANKRLCRSAVAEINTTGDLSYSIVFSILQPFGWHLFYMTNVSS